MNRRQSSTRIRKARLLSDWPLFLVPLSVRRTFMKTVWTIVAGLGAMIILSFIVIVVTIAHPPKIGARALSHKKTPDICNCNGRCMRQRVK
jgi:hypothetical protein